MDIKTIIIISALVVSAYLIGFNRGEHKGFGAGIMAQITGGIRFKIDDSEDEEDDNEN